MRTITICILVTCAGFLALRAAPQSKTSAEVQFQAAINKETIEGDLKGAIEQYKKIAQGNNRVMAAQALIRMGECYEKLGSKEARKQYDLVISKFADQKDAVAIARARLGGSAGSSGALAQRLLCTECGDSEASTSIDGRWIVFTDARSGDLAIRDLATGQVSRLMAKSGYYKDSLASAEEPVLSRDARQVAYRWNTGEPPIHIQLRVMANEPGGKSRVVLDGNIGDVLDWSADGKSILAILQQGVTRQLAWVSAADGAVKAIKTLSSPLAGNTPSKVSPDGLYIAYAARATSAGSLPPAPAASSFQDEHIYVLAADGSSETEVVKTAGVNRSPVWTPDGKHLLYLSNSSGSSGLWSIAIAKGKAAGVPSLVSPSLGNGQVWPMSATTSGSYNYILEQDGVEQISVVDIDAAGRKIQGRAQNAESFVGIRAAWSPDGRSIAFKRHHPGIERSTNYRTGSYDLVVHSLETGAERTFPASLGDYDSNTPEWFHDGKGILVGLEKNGLSIGEYRLDVASGEFKQILESRLVNNGAPIWFSPDEKVLYLFVGGVVAHNLATGNDTRILSVPPGGRLSHRLSPDGRTWAVASSDFQARKLCICTAGADGSNLRELYVPDFTVFFTNLAWTRDGRTILFDQPRGDDKAKISSTNDLWSRAIWPRQIMRIPAQGGAPEFTGIEVEGVLANMDVSPDGSRLAYTATNPVLELRSLDNVLSALK